MSDIDYKAEKLIIELERKARKNPKKALKKFKAA